MRTNRMAANVFYLLKKRKQSRRTEKKKDDMETVLIVTTTFERYEDAEHMAEQLLRRRLVACAQILGPITSRYWWKDEIVKAQEYQLVLKSDEHVYVDLEGAIRAGHPYETPEIVAVRSAHASEPYRLWLRGEMQL